MNRIIISLTALAVFSMVMGSASMAEAEGHGGHAAVHAHVAVHHAVAHHVNAYHHGNYHFSRYHLRGYRGWSRWYWNTSFGCYYYLCPTDNVWYYWYQPAQCYLPVDSIATYPPAASPMPPPGPLTSTPPLPPGI